MSLPTNPHRAALAEQAVEILNRYHEFPSNYEVTFSLGRPDANGLPRIAAKLVRPDGVPFAESKDPVDQKIAHLKDQTAVVRPFYLAKARRDWDDTGANEFTNVDFDYAAIIGYGPTEDGVEVKSLYFVPTEALLDRQQPGEDGVWRLRLATYYVSQLSLEPRKKFAKFLYLSQRMREALEYQYDQMGFFYSNP